MPKHLIEDVQLKNPVYLQSINDPATWDVTAGTGTVTISAAGNLLITSASGVAQSIRRVGNFVLPMGGAVVVRMKRDANLSVLDFYVRTASYATPKVYSANLGVSPMPVGEWYEFTFPLAVAAGLPTTPLATDKDKIVGVEIKVTPAAGTVTALEVEWVRVAEGSSTPGVCFQFDDGRLDTYTVAYPILKAAGYKGSIAIEHTAVGTVGAGTASRCTQAQLNELYAAGWAMMGHHTVQLTTLTAAQQESVHQASKDYLSAQGFTRGADHWVWPGGSTNSSTEKIARKYWKTRRRVSPLLTNGVATVGAGEPSDPNIFYITSDKPTSLCKTRIDQVVKTGGVVVFVFHSIVASGATAEDWLTAQFQELVDYCKSSGLKSFDYDEVFQPRHPERLAQ